MSSTTPPGFLVAGGGTGAVGFAGGAAGAAFPADGADIVGLTVGTAETVGLTRGLVALAVVGLPTAEVGNVLAPFMVVDGALVAFPGCLMAGEALLGAWVLGCVKVVGDGEVLLRLGVAAPVAGLATRERSILK